MGLGRGRGVGLGRGNPYPFCRCFPWLPRGWWTSPQAYGEQQLPESGRSWYPGIWPGITATGNTPGEGEVGLLKQQEQAISIGLDQIRNRISELEGMAGESRGQGGEEK